MQVNTEVLICNLKYSISKEIHVVFHNIIIKSLREKTLAKEFEGEFNCVRENTYKIQNLLSFNNKRS